MISKTTLPSEPPAAQTERGFSVSTKERLQVLSKVCGDLSQAADKIEAAAARAKAVLEKELAHNLAEQAHGIRGGVLSLRNYVSRLQRPRTGWTAGNPTPAILGGTS